MARRTHLPMPSTQREDTLCGAGLHHESEGTPPPLIAESMQGADCQRCLKMIEAPFYRERVQRHFNDSSVQPAKPPATRVSLKRRWVKWVAALVGGLLVIMVVIAIVAPPADDEQAAAAAPHQQAVEQAQERLISRPSSRRRRPRRRLISRPSSRRRSRQRRLISRPSSRRRSNQRRPRPTPRSPRAASRPGTAITRASRP